MENTEKKFKVNDKVYALGIVGNYAYGYIKAVYSYPGDKNKEYLSVYFPKAKQTGDHYSHSDFVATLEAKKAYDKDLKVGGFL